MSKKYSHINSNGTGCQMVVTPFEAWNGEEGSVKFSFYPQKGVIQYDDDDCMVFFCTPEDVARMVAVFRGMQENIDDGKGLRRLGSIMNLEHTINPNGYRFTIIEKVDNGTKSLSIMLSTYEAMELSLALEGVMSKLVFGM